MHDEPSSLQAIDRLWLDHVVPAWAFEPPKGHGCGHSILNSSVEKTKSSGEAERSRFWQIDQNTFWQILTACVLYDLFVLHFFWDKLWWFPAEVLVWGGNSCRDFSSWCQKAQRREPICWTSKLQMQHVLQYMQYFAWNGILFQAMNLFWKDFLRISRVLEEREEFLGRYIGRSLCNSASYRQK